MSIRLRVGLVIAAVALLPTVAAADISPACKQAVGVGGAKFVKKVLKLGQRCAMRKGANACRPDPRHPSGTPALDAAIDRAASRLANRVRAACAGDDLSAFAARCAPGGGTVDVATLVTCLRDSHVNGAAAMLAVEFPLPNPNTSKTGCAAGETCECSCSAGSPSGAFL
jgi:hypothetical protein